MGAELGQRESVAFGLGHQAEPGGCPEQPVQRPRVGRGGGCQRGDVPGARPDAVGDSQPGDELGHAYPYVGVVSLEQFGGRGPGALDDLTH